MGLPADAPITIIADEPTAAPHDGSATAGTHQHSEDRQPLPTGPLTIDPLPEPLPPGPLPIVTLPEPLPP
eukprot:458847-Pyramimonas_sp.AAC.1